MADSNSKKPMALLLLVVVAVLVVIMVNSGGGAEWTGHASLDNKEACEAAKGTWTDAADEVPAGTDADGNATEAVPAVEASCAAPADYTGFSEEDCAAAHGTWGGAKEAGTDAEGNATEAVADSCSAPADDNADAADDNTDTE